MNCDEEMTDDEDDGSCDSVSDLRDQSEVDHD